MLKIEVVGDKALIARLHSMPEAVRRQLLVKVRELTLILEARVKQKLSGDVLHVRTGALRSGIFSEVTETSTAIQGRVAASKTTPYAAIHEFGGKINIPEIVPVKAKALHFMIGGKEVFAKRVRAHTVNMPERSFLRSSLNDLHGEIKEGLTEAVREGLHE